VLPFLLKSIRWQGVPVALPEPKPSLTVVGPVWLSSAFEQLGIIYEQDPHSNAETSYAVVKDGKQELFWRCSARAASGTALTVWGELDCGGDDDDDDDDDDEAAAPSPPPAIGSVVVTAEAWEAVASGDEGVATLPLAAVAIGVAYTLVPCRANRTCADGEGASEPLVLDAFAIGRLCSGEIRTWDDDYLVSLNPWLVGVGTVPIVLQAEPSTSDTMAALRDKLQALGQLTEPDGAFCPAAHVQPSSARVSSAVLHDEYSLGILPVGGAVPHGWASLATCPPPKSGEWRSLIFDPAAAAACRARAMPPAVANLRSCSWPLSADAARPTEPCYPLAVFALLLVPTDFRGDECAALEAESVPKQLARYLAWLYGLDTADDSSGVAPLHRALARESMAFMGRECELDEAHLAHELTREALYQLTCETSPRHRRDIAERSARHRREIAERSPRDRRAAERPAAPPHRWCPACARTAPFFAVLPPSSTKGGSPCPPLQMRRPLAAPARRHERRGCDGFDLADHV